MDRELAVTGFGLHQGFLAVVIGLNSGANQHTVLPIVVGGLLVAIDRDECDLDPRSTWLVTFKVPPVWLNWITCVPIGEPLR